MNVKAKGLREAALAWAPLGILAIWPLITAWPGILHLSSVWMAPGAPFSDLLISHWPDADWIRRSLWEYHQLPLWNPSILGGAPMAADPLASLWYPPNWVTLVLPLPFAFNLLFVLHLAWGGAGMYRWAVEEGFSRLAGLAGGLAFAAMPKLIAHWGAGHVTLVWSVCWTPWVMLYVDRVLRLSGTHLQGQAMALAGTAWAALALADVRWGALASLAVAAWWLSSSVAWTVRLKGLVLTASLAALLAAALWLPLAEFVSLSARTGLTPQEAAVFSLPPSYLVGLLVPNLGGFQEYMTYLGLAPLALAMIGAWQGIVNRRRQVAAMVLIGLIAVWWSLGPSAGLFWLASRVPGLSLLRVPSRAWFLAGLAVAWLAVRGAGALEAGLRPAGRAYNLAMAAAAALAWLLAIGGSLVTHRALGGFIVTAAAITAVAVGLKARLPVAILVLVSAVELAWVDGSLLEPRAVSDQAVTAWLAAQPGTWRVYSPSYSLPQLDAAQASLLQADGINPLQLARTAAFMDGATGVPRSGYSVTTPPFKDDVATSNKGAVPDARRLGEMNVRYVVSAFDLDAPGLVLKTTLGGTRVYENAYDTGLVRGGQLAAWSPNRIVVKASGPGAVHVSQAWYPGWMATIDGSPTPLKADGPWQLVDVPADSHEIVFEFKPPVIVFGLTLSLLGLVVAGWMGRRR